MAEMSEEQLIALVGVEDSGADVDLEWSSEAVNLEGTFTVVQLEAIIELKKRGQA